MRQLQCDIPAPTKGMLPLDSVTGSVIRTLTVSVTLAAVDRVTVSCAVCYMISHLSVAVKLVRDVSTKAYVVV